MKELRFWADLTPAQASVTLVAPSQVVDLYTDASVTRWGAVCLGKSVSGYFPPPLQEAHIGVKELYAVYAGMQRFAPELAGARVQLFCDN